MAWFLSLGAGAGSPSRARAAFHLPISGADVGGTEAGWVEYRSDRVDRRGPVAVFEGRYRPVGPAAVAAPGSLAAFLTDRNGLYAADRVGRLSWTAIRHAPWPLQPAEAEIRANTMAAAHGLALPSVPPLSAFREAARRPCVVAPCARREARRRPVSRGAGAPAAAG